MASGIAGTLSSMVTTIGGQTDVGDNAGHKATPGSGVKSGGSVQRGPQTPQTPMGAQTPPRMKAPQVGGSRKAPPSNKPKLYSSTNPPLGTPMPAAPHPGVIPPYPDARSPHPMLSPTGVPIMPPPPNIMGQGMAPLGPRVPLTFTPGMTGLLGR